MDIEITVTDNTAEALEAMKSQVKLGLDSIGESMEKYAKSGCPVDTGRLRDSIVYATETSQGSPGPMAEGEDGIPHGTPPELEVQVGTNVEYAKYVEFGDNKNFTTGGAHFLRDGAQGHSDEFKSILEAALQ